MRGMRLRITILLPLLMVAGLVSVAQPGRASGPWEATVKFTCQAKRVNSPLSDNGLSFPTVKASPMSGKAVLYTILCGKAFNGGHNKHPSLVANLCVYTEILDPNAKKHNPKKDVPTRPSNCLLLALMHIAGYCYFWTGDISGSVHYKRVEPIGTWKLIWFRGSWPVTVGEIVEATGTASKTGPIPPGGTGPHAFESTLDIQPDTLNKNDSCETGDGKAQNFVVKGKITFTAGVK